MTLNSKEKDRILSKIRKLLNMAERAKGNEEEAAIAASQVEKMLRKYNLSLGDVTPEEAKSDVTERANTDYKWTPGRAPLWVNKLAIDVATAYETHCMWVQSATGNDSHVKKAQMNLRFIGFTVDVAVSLDMFKYLYETIVRLSNDWAKNPETFIPKGKARTYKNSYRMGMATRIGEKLKEMKVEKEAEYAAVGTSLVIVKENAIAEHLGRKPAYGRGKRSTAATDGMAFSSGYHKGGSVNINKQLPGS